MTVDGERCEFCQEGVFRKKSEREYQCTKCTGFHVDALPPSLLARVAMTVAPGLYARYLTWRILRWFSRILGKYTCEVKP